MDQPNKLKKQQIIAELYRRGNLSYKCHAVQKEMYDIYYNSKPNSTLVWLISRQLGKSFLLSLLALEQAYRKPKSIIKIVTDTKDHLKNILLPIFDKILVDCPDDLKPVYLKADYTFNFPNGSIIQLAGTDAGHYERLRGQTTDFVAVDEAGFCTNLETIVKSVLIPTTTHTGARIILASTPPEDEEHDFIDFIEEAEYRNYLTKKTIYENPLLNTEQVNRIIHEMGGINSPRFRREYMCEVISNTDTTIIPEFTDDLQKRIIKEWPKPPHFDSYVSMDLGARDLTAVLFAYYDFRSNKVVIEDEIILDMSKKDNNLKYLMQEINKKEQELWYNALTNEVIRPIIRVSDINYLVTDEIARASDYQIVFRPAKKDELEAAIHDLRVLIQSEKLIIHPRCTNLIRHVKHAKWKAKQNKAEFARSADNGHYDALAALIYLARSVMFKRNPYPAGFDYNSKDLYINNKHKFFQGNDFSVYQKIFNIKSKRKF